MKILITIALLTLSTLASADAWTPQAPQMPQPPPIVHCYPTPSGGFMCY